MTDIIFIEDIIKELAQEKGIDEKELKELLDLNIDYLYSKTLDSNVVSINIPFLGVLHLNRRKVNMVYEKRSKKFRPIIKSQLEIIDDMKSRFKELVHCKTSYFSRARRNYFKTSDEKRRARKLDVFKIMEKNQ